MRAIIIDDKDCKALVDKLELTKVQPRIYDMAQGNLTEDQIKFAAQHMHRIFHYEVVKWFNDQGAKW